MQPADTRITYRHRSPTVKTVGRRKMDPLVFDSRTDSKDNARAWRRAFPTPFVPKGVYRFASHEEADEWLWKKITHPS
jgi:hypothetical protein